MCNKKGYLHKQSGMALIEALIAMLVLALGILALIGVQARTIVETRVTNNRAIAIRQINDLNERIWLNREQALAGQYNVNFATLGDAPTGCDTTWNVNRTGANIITASNMAACDVWLWRRALVANIAGAQAQIQNVVGTNQIRILVAWPLNEKNNMALDASLQARDASGANVCPNGFICHIQVLEM